jgi:crotonobetainyl-CoA:carnitine CoA-transferase CaiB-like acyl-CoA transferase
MNGRDPKRIGNRSLWYAPQGCYRCTGDDNWIVITVHNDAEWAALAGVAGHPEWADDKRFADVLSRFENHDAIDALITAWTQTQDHYEATRALQAAGVIAAPVLSPKQVLLDEHLRDRKFFDRVQTANGPRPVPHQLGAKFSAFEMNSARNAPKLGEHNAEILQGELGMTDDEMAALKEQGVIGEEPVLAVPLQVMRMFVQWPLTSYLGMGALQAIEEDFEEQLGIKE